MISSNGPLSASYIENIGAQPFLLCPSYLLPVDDLSVAGFALCAVREMFVLYKCLESQMSLLLRWVCFLPSAQPGARNVPSWWMLAWMQELCGRGYLDGRLIYLPSSLEKSMAHSAHSPRNLYAGQEATVRALCGTTGWFKIEKEAQQGCLLSVCLSNLHADRAMRDAGLGESQTGIKICIR